MLTDNCSLLHRILVIRFSSLGDLVLTTPLYRELRQAFPDAEITLLTSEGCGEVLANNPHLDHILFHPRHERFSELQALAAQLNTAAFDLVYDAHRSLRSRWLVARLTAFGLKSRPTVWVINKRGWQRLALIKFRSKRMLPVRSQREQWLLPLEQQLGRSLPQHTELFPESKSIVRVRTFMSAHHLEPKRFLAIGPSASQPLKCWPLEHFRTLIAELFQRGWPLVLVGGPDEPEPELLAEEFGDDVINAAGIFTPLESAELLRYAVRVICNDTSIAHLAEAMHTPALALFGPTVREFGYAPLLPASHLLETELDLPCRPCSKDGRGLCRNATTLQCLTSLSPEQVLRHVPDFPD
jgi:heptosyltransferase-2